MSLRISSIVNRDFEKSLLLLRYLPLHVRHTDPTSVEDPVFITVAVCRCIVFDPWRNCFEEKVLLPACGKLTALLRVSVL